MVFREEQSKMEYDFDLRFTNGETAAIEVTSSRDRESIEMHKRISNPRKGGSRILASRCKLTWCVFALPDADIDIIRKNADERLAKLEAAGIEEFDYIRANAFMRRIALNYSQLGYPEKDNPSTAIAAEVCNELRLMSGTVVGSSPKPEIIISRYPSGASVGASCATDAAEKEIAPNKEKLGRATAKERHLVVYIDQSNGKAWIGMESFAPPSSKPNLPEEVTHIWLIAQIEKDRFVVWCGSKTEEWHIVDLPTVSQESSIGEQ
jgi:hypothetical protein